MKSKFIYLLLVLLFNTSCRKEKEKFKLVSTPYLTQKDSFLEKKEKKTDIILFFSNKEKVKLNSYNLNFNKDVTKLNTMKRTINGKYLYCGKSVPNSHIISCLENLDSKKSEELKKYRTGHSILINNKDTVYFQGKNNITCKNNGSNVILKILLYQIISDKDTLNYPVIYSILENKERL